MKTQRIQQWLMAALILAGLAVAAAPAGADSGPWFRFKQGHRDAKVIRRVSYAPQRVIVERGDGAGPALAGFIGGLVLGSVIRSESAPCPRVAPAPCPSALEYYDPYCDESFGSFGACAAHMRDADHPRVIRVIDAASGDWVDTYRWYHGDWRDGAWFAREGRQPGRHQGWDRGDDDEN